MVFKYNLQTTDNRRQTTEGEDRSFELGVSSKNSELKTQYSELKTQNFKLRFWWLWYPYRWAIGLRGLFKVISGK